jgi:hypothetical protein
MWRLQLRILLREGTMRKFVLVALLLAVVPAQAGTILWNQGAFSSGSVAIVDQEFGDTPTFSTYIVNDVAVPGGGWVINSVTSYFVAGWNWTYSGTTIPVRLHIFPQSGVLPLATDIVPDLNPPNPYTASYSASGGDVTLTVSGLAISLAPGSYWIGITPIANMNPYGQIFYYSTTDPWGDPSALRNPGGGFGLPSGVNWGGAQANIDLWPGPDGTLVIEGTMGIPEPSTMVLLGLGLLGLPLLRRRKQSL